jgi:son of sevenless
MSAIMAALTSQVIAKLQLTWAHVSRASHVEPLVKISEPTGNFAAYRNLFSTVEGPCLPYIGGYYLEILKDVL